MPTVAPTVQPTSTPIPTSGPLPTVKPTATPTPTQAPSSITYIYDEKLADGWVDWTWSSTTNFNDTSHPYKGSKNLLWKPQAQWAGFLPADEAGFDSTGYTAFTFAIQATKPNQKINVQLYTYNDVELGVNTDIAKYGGDPIVGQYKVYTIPLADLAGVNQKLLKFHIQDGSGNTTNILYLDAVGFVKAGTAVNPTTTPTQPGPTITPTPTPVSTKLSIYDDALHAGWESWSWDSVLDFGVNSPIFSGSKAISYIASAAWSGMDLHNQTGVSTSSYTTLHFVLKAAQAGQQYAVFLEGANGQQLKAPISLNTLGGNPTADAWKEYSISLSDLNATNTTITGVVIHEVSGTAQPAVFVDDIYLQ